MLRYRTGWAGVLWGLVAWVISLGIAILFLVPPDGEGTHIARSPAEYTIER